MSSGRDMIAVVFGPEADLGKRALYCLGVSGLCRYVGQRKASGDGKVSRNSKAKSSTTFWCSPPHIGADRRVSPLALDATFGLTSSCGNLPSRPFQSPRTLREAASRHVDITVAWIHWYHTGLCLLDAGNRYLGPPEEPIGGATSPKLTVQCSLGALLPFRACRRAYCICEKAAVPSHLWRRRHPASPPRGRQVPS